MNAFPLLFCVAFSDNKKQLKVQSRDYIDLRLSYTAEQFDIPPPLMATEFYTL